MKTKISKKTYHFIMIAIATFAFANSLFSQVSPPLMLKDIVFIKNVPNEQDDSLKVKYTIFFKLNRVADAKGAHIKLGTLQDLGDILQIAPLYSYQNNKYFLNYNSKQFEHANYTSNIEVSILKQDVLNLKYMTLSVEDKSGNFTAKQYYHIQQ